MIARWRLSLTLAAATLLAAAPARAQTVAGGYSFVHDLGEGETSAVDYPAGWFASVTAPIGASRWYLTGEVSSQQRTNLDVERQRLTGYLGGLHVRLAGGGRFNIFARALAGVEKFSEPGFNEWNFAFQPGAGLSVLLWKDLAARVQTDYRLVQADVTLQEIQVSVGVAIAFGR